MVNMVKGTPTDAQIYYRKTGQFHSGVNMKTGRCCCDSVFSQRKTVYVYEQPKMPTALKATFWSIAIKNFADIGMGIANFFMGIFGKKKASAPVQTPAATQNNQVTQEKQGVNTPTPSVATPQKATNPQEVKPEKEENNKKKQTNEKKYNVPSSVDIYKFNGNVIVHDDGLGEKGDITGKTTVSKETGQNGYPQKITVGKYNYTLYRVEDNGTVWYKSQNGSEQLYRLEKNNNDTYGLNQHAEDEGVGKADVSKWKKTTTTNSKKTQTPASTTTTTSTNNTQSTTTQANASQQKTTSTDKKTPANTSIRTDDELKDTMHINEKLDLKKIPTFNDMSTDRKPYSPMTVTYGYSPEMQTVDISAEEVAKCQGDEAKIKDLALKKIREKEQPESQKTK